jgi:hypothetical protein
MMNVTFLFELDRVLLAGYIVFVVFLNATLYLVSAFYQKKFSQKTLKSGFVGSIVFSLLYIVTVFVSVKSGRTLGIVQSALLILSAAASVISSSSLYFKMRKPRK